MKTKRIATVLLALLVAAAAGAANPYYLDSNGVLWTASTSLNGLQLTGTSEGNVVAQAAVPFPYGAPGTSDTQIQVAADSQTGKVAVVWQRNWAPGVSDVMLAIWNNGQWETIQKLSDSSQNNPRFPVVHVSQVSTSVPDPDDPTLATTVSNSFIEVAWSEGTAPNQHGTIAVWELDADSPDTALVFEGSLGLFVFMGVSLDTTVPPEVVDHPQFASQSAVNGSLLFFGMQQTNLFYLLQVNYVVDSSVLQRRRHIPVFGVTKTFPLTQTLSMDNARIVLGNNLNPVAYRVDSGTIQYVTYGSQGWSPLHTLPVANGLTLDQAIPLVENLAH